MTKDLTWCLPFDEEVRVEHRRAADGRFEFYVNRFYSDGGSADGPYPTRCAAREAALALVEEIYRERGR